MKRTVSVIITDLDDTLWNWLRIWHRPFKAMLDQLAEDSGVPKDELLRDFKEVHTRHGTSEYAFALEELPSLLKKHSPDEIPIIYNKAIDAYRQARAQVLELYPDVQETLEQIKDSGALIVGYTESLAFYTQYRLRKLGLDRILDYLYSPADHDLPEGVSHDTLRYYPPEHYQLRRTVHRHTPKGAEKPNAEVLLQILSDIGASRDEAIYVGDKLVKDLAMAQAAGVMDVHAAYGEAHGREEYDLLRQVTHWRLEAVQKEAETTTNEVRPSYTLRKSFAELGDHFVFTQFIDRSPQRISHILDTWKKSVDVQMHFNEIEMKIRNYVITLVIAVIGAAGFAVKEGLPSLLLPIGVLGVIGVALFAMMDILWYHRLLLGAVDHARAIEKRYLRHLPELSLSEAIGKKSPVICWGKPIHSTHRLYAFYVVLVLAIVVMMPLIWWFAPPEDNHERNSTVSQASKDLSGPPVREDVVGRANWTGSGRVQTRPP